MGNMYKPRIADRLLVRKLAGKGAVLIEGPKWCGKTTTARQQAKSLLDLVDINGDAIHVCAILQSARRLFLFRLSLFDLC